MIHGKYRGYSSFVFSDVKRRLFQFLNFYKDYDIEKHVRKKKNSRSRIHLCVCVCVCVCHGAFKITNDVCLKLFNVLELKNKQTNKQTTSSNYTTVKLMEIMRKSTVFAIVL